MAKAFENQQVHTSKYSFISLLCTYHAKSLLIILLFSVFLVKLMYYC